VQTAVLCYRVSLQSVCLARIISGMSGAIHETIEGITSPLCCRPTSSSSALCLAYWSSGFWTRVSAGDPIIVGVAVLTSLVLPFMALSSRHAPAG
jgi:hypothetical protein